MADMDTLVFAVKELFYFVFVFCFMWYYLEAFRQGTLRPEAVGRWFKPHLMRIGLYTGMVIAIVEFLVRTTMHLLQ